MPQNNHKKKADKQTIIELTRTANAYHLTIHLKLAHWLIGAILLVPTVLGSANIEEITQSGLNQLMRVEQIEHKHGSP